MPTLPRSLASYCVAFGIVSLTPSISAADSYRVCPTDEVTLCFYNKSKKSWSEFHKRDGTTGVKYERAMKLIERKSSKFALPGTPSPVLGESNYLLNADCELEMPRADVVARVSSHDGDFMYEEGDAVFMEVLDTDGDGYVSVGDEIVAYGAPIVTSYVSNATFIEDGYPGRLALPLSRTITNVEVSPQALGEYLILDFDSDLSCEDAPDGAPCEGFASVVITFDSATISDAGARTFYDFRESISFSQPNEFGLDEFRDIGLGIRVEDTTIGSGFFPIDTTRMEVDGESKFPSVTTTWTANTSLLVTYMVPLD